MHYNYQCKSTGSNVDELRVPLPYSATKQEATKPRAGTILPDASAGWYSGPSVVAWYAIMDVGFRRWNKPSGSKFPRATQLRDGVDGKEHIS